jgi:hypothetical protein
MIVLAAQGKLDSIVGGPIDEALFANVGDNAEHPDTIAYVHDVMIPWSKSNGITINELRQPHNRDLYDELMNPDNKYTGVHRSASAFHLSSVEFILILTLS